MTIRYFLRLTLVRNDDSLPEDEDFHTISLADSSETEYEPVAKLAWEKLAWLLSPVMEKLDSQ